MATIERRGNSWRVYWRTAGRKQSTTWPAEKVARRAKDIAEAHRHQLTADEVYATILGTPLPQPAPEPPAPKLPTVAEWADLWLSTRTRVAPGTVGRYRQQLRDHILPEFGDLRLDEVEGSHISLLLNKLREQFKDTTVTRYYACIHALFEYAVVEKKIGDNPARRTDWVRDIIAHDDASDDGENHVYLTKQEFALIHRCADPFARPVLRVLVGTGCRWSEATAIPVSAVNPLAKPGTARVHRAWKRDDKGRWYLGATKGRKRRTVMLGPGLVDEVILGLVAGERSDVLLLRAKRGGRLDNANFRYRYWEPAIDAAQRCDAHPPAVGPDAGGRWPRGAVSTCECPTRLRQRPTLHDLRHSHVAWLIADGRPIVAISRQLGHSSTAITESVYAGILPHVDAAIAVAADVDVEMGAVPDGDQVVDGLALRARSIQTAT